MFSILSRIKKIRKDRRTDKEFFRYAKQFLKPGLYFFNNNIFQQVSLRKLNFHQIVRCFLCFGKGCVLARRNKLALSSSAEYQFGLAKDIFLYDDYVVGWFKDKALYEKAKTNYTNNINSFVYPIVDIIAFNNDSNSLVMRRINGVQYKDRQHDDYVIEKLFEYAIKTPVTTDNGECVQLQHGDVKRENIIWNDDKNFIFIDLDNISYRPILFDVLHYCAVANISLEEIVSIINKNISYIKVLFSRFKLAFNSEYLDYIFSCYVSFFVRLGDCYEDIAFLTNSDLSAYPKTAELLSKLR